MAIHQTVAMARKFGWLFTAIFAFVAILAALTNNPAFSLFACAISAVFLYLSIFKPPALVFPSNLWIGFGVRVSKIANPLVLGLVYIVSILPVALILALLRIKLLDVKWNQSAESYWKNRAHQPGNLSRQY